MELNMQERKDLAGVNIDPEAITKAIDTASNAVTDLSATGSLPEFYRMVDRDLEEATFLDQYGNLDITNTIIGSYFNVAKDYLVNTNRLTRDDIDFSVNDISSYFEVNGKYY